MNCQIMHLSFLMHSWNIQKKTIQKNKESCLGFKFMGSLKLRIQNSTFTRFLDMLTWNMKKQKKEKRHQTELT
ncbi:Hypothetical predicted protein, partial [Olea europaea subsp. europaea]